MLDQSTLIVLGPHDNVDRLATFMGGPGPGGHVVLVGAGRVGQEAGKVLNQANIYSDLTKTYSWDTKIICVVRGDELIEPSVDFYLQKNDRIIVLGTADDINNLTKLAL